MARRKILIVGGGIAGTAAAWHLARGHGAEVILVERARQPGMHASGRSAAILRTGIEEACLRAMALASADFYRAPPPGFAPGPLLREVGVFLAVAEAAAAAGAACADADGAREVPIGRLQAAWPELAPGLARSWYAARDGVVDVPATLGAFLAGACAAGARWAAASCAVELLRDESGAVRGARVLRPHAAAPEDIEADAVLLAGGAWAAEIAAAARLPLPLAPRRRHLLLTAPLPEVRPEAPVVWLLGDDECYFRPEAGGLLASACDEGAVDLQQGETPEPAEGARIGRALARWLPRWAGAPPARLQAGMRTFAPDGRFVLGPDPRADGLYWAAGLGGHGISCGPEVGRIAAAWAAGAAPEVPHAGDFLPARLLAPARDPAATAPAGAPLRA